MQVLLSQAWKKGGGRKAIIQWYQELKVWRGGERDSISVVILTVVVVGAVPSLGPAQHAQRWAKLHNSPLVLLCVSYKTMHRRSADPACLTLNVFAQVSLFLLLTPPTLSHQSERGDDEDNTVERPESAASSCHLVVMHGWWLLLYKCIMRSTNSMTPNKWETLQLE